MDLQADYGLQLGPVTVHFLASLFNVLNRQQTISRWTRSGPSIRRNNDLPEPTNPQLPPGNTAGSSRERCGSGVRVSF